MKKSLFLFVLFGLTTSFSTIAPDLEKDAATVEQLPDIPFLPEPLTLNEGDGNQKITNKNQWLQKRDWIKDQYEYWVSGSIPPAPDKIHPEILSERRENGVLIRKVVTRFGPEKKAQMTIELMIPPVSGKLPVFMTQWNHRGWAQVAVRRGYIGCVYAGADAKDDTESYAALYPGADFARLMRRAWGAHRVIDYLYSIPEIVDANRIGLTGHSRNGKQSLMAAAFDERIDAVISSSGGTGAENPFRFTDERFNNNPIEEITRKNPSWFNSRLRLFIGNEQKLPVDQNSLMVLIAPRGLMLSSAITEGQGNPWAIEQAYQSVKELYDFLGSRENIAINLRRGRHATAARDIEDFVDFFDYEFGRSKRAPENKLFYDYTFERWKETSGVNIDPEDFPVVKTSTGNHKGKISQEDKQNIKDQISWILGEEPPGILNNSDLSWAHRKTEDDYLGDIIGEPEWSGMKKMLIWPYNSMGDYLWGNLYLPDDADIEDNSVKGEYPLVIYLHAYSYATGYRRRITPFLRKLTEQGFAVLAFDQIGFGTRIEESKYFYDRYPNWSLMGKMVADTRNVINDVVERIGFIDPGRVFLCGYSLGGTVALFTAAMDEWVKGVAVVGSFGSFRMTDPATEGNKHYSHLHGLIPKLGFFERHEDRIPVDFDDVLSCIAPKPLYIIAPPEDRHHPASQVQTILAPVKKVYKELGENQNLQFHQPETYDHFTDTMMDEMVRWLHSISQ